MSISSKVCLKCDICKPFYAFSKCSAREDGLQSYCKECSKKVFKLWAYKNKEKLIEKRKGLKYVYSEKARKRENEWHRQDYKENKETILKRNKAWSASNPQRVRELSLIGTNRRKVVQLGAEGSHTEEEWHLLIEECKWKCVCCGDSTKPLTKDHIVPLSKGGSDWIGNIQPLCSKCNSSKRDKTIRYREVVSCDWLSSLL